MRGQEFILFLSLYASINFSMLFLMLIVRDIKSDKEGVGVQLASIIASVSWAIFYTNGGFS